MTIAKKLREKAMTARKWSKERFVKNTVQTFLNFAEHEAGKGKTKTKLVKVIYPKDPLYSVETAVEIAIEVQVALQGEGFSVKFKVIGGSEEHQEITINLQVKW